MNGVESSESYVVLANIGTDWPEVFGPFSRAQADTVATELEKDHRVNDTEISMLFVDAAEYRKLLDELEAWDAS